MIAQEVTTVAIIVNPFVGERQWNVVYSLLWCLNCTRLHLYYDVDKKRTFSLYPPCCYELSGSDWPSYGVCHHVSFPPSLFL